MVLSFFLAPLNTEPLDAKGATTSMYLKQEQFVHMFLKEINYISCTINCLQTNECTVGP